MFTDANGSANDGADSAVVALERLTEGRVIVAMSGGVDSSVVAALMHRENYDVVGISMRLYATATSAPGKGCCSPDDLYDARAVASELGFPFYVANYQEAFRERVVDYFVDEYRRGRTPSPCILCNDHLKFDVLLQRMQALDGKGLATGHYARIEEREGGRLALLCGVDKAKDQSYFLFGLKRENLAHVHFPLGGMTKDQVRALAVELGLDGAADKRESQDLCFVGGGNYAEFVEARLKAEDIRTGDIVHATTGEVLGKHEGIHRYTVGQRKGLGIAYPEPLYVKGVDPKTGQLLVGNKDEIAASTAVVTKCNWLRWETPPAEFQCTVKVRYRHRAVPCRVTVSSEDPTVVELKFDSPESAVAPGQAAVFYDGDEVLGGGWIEVAQ